MLVSKLHILNKMESLKVRKTTFYFSPIFFLHEHKFVRAKTEKQNSQSRKFKHAFRLIDTFWARWFSVKNTKKLNFSFSKIAHKKNIT